MMNEIDKLVEQKLLFIHSELEQQQKVGDTYSEGSLSFNREMAQIREYIELAGEYSVAFELIVSTLEIHDFTLTSKSAVFLLEIGLIMGFKTERKDDSLFNIREKMVTEK